jgi:hypothetical protein
MDFNKITPAKNASDCKFYSVKSQYEIGRENRPLWIVYTCEFRARFRIKLARFKKYIKKTC